MFSGGFETCSWKRTIACGLIGALAAPTSLHAAWQDRSGELPGLVSGKSIALLAAAGGGAIATLFWLKKRNSRKEQAGIAVGPARVDFGSIAHGTSANGAIVVSNTNGHPVTIQDVELSGGAFSLDRGPELPLILKPGQRTQLPVKFGPSMAGDHSGVVKLRALSDGKDKMFKVSLKGKALVGATP